MSHFSVSNQVDYDVFAKFLSELSGELESSLNILNAISIYMEDRCVNAFSNIWSVDTRTRFVWSCSETDLVVYDDMNYAADLIIF